MRRTLVRAMFVALLLASLALPAAADFPEYAVKAALVVEFTRFVTWPEWSLGGPDRPFVIGVLGRDPMRTELVALAHDLTVHGRPVEVRPLSNAAGAGGCQAVWIAASERDDLAAILAKTGGHPILTVSDSPGFVERGVHVNLIRKDGRIGFEVNLAAAERSALVFSSEMLRLATIVESGH